MSDPALGGGTDQMKLATDFGTTVTGFVCLTKGSNVTSPLSKLRRHS